MNLIPILILILNLILEACAVVIIIVELVGLYLINYTLSNADQ